MIKKVILPLIILALALTSCADPNAGSGVPTFFKDTKEVSVGEYHTAAIKNDGTLWTWGSSNGCGVLGDGTTFDIDTPVQVGVDRDWIAVSAGVNHTVAIREDADGNRTLWAWGLNTYGRLGDGTTTDRYSPVQVRIDASTFFKDVKTVSAGNAHTVAIKNDGTIWAWGYNGEGQLGDGTTTNRSNPAQVKIDASTFFKDVKTVSAGWYHTVAIKNDGTIWAWGYNEYGQLGNGKSGVDEYSNFPVKIGDRWKAVSTMNYHTAAIRDDGVLWTWGYNYYGQLGDATMENRSTPVRVILSDW